MDAVRNKIAKLIAFIDGEDLEKARELLRDILSDELVLRRPGECIRKYIDSDDVEDYDDYDDYDNDGYDNDDYDDETEYCVTCNECGFEFEVEGDEVEEITQCPKCGSDDLIIDECE